MEAAAFVILVSGAALLFTLRQGHWRRKGWEVAAKACGLQVVEEKDGWSPKLRARAGPVSARFEAFGDKGRYVQIVVEGPAPPDFHRMKIRPESGFELGREIEIGDRDFDGKFFIEGPERLVRALLDAETRRLLVKLKESGTIAINAGELRAIVSGSEEITSILRLLLDVRQRFAPPVDVLRRLVENATRDPESGVRLQNLLLLIHELSWSPETDSALRQACSDPVPEIRLRAARQLGAEGHGVLLELAEKLEDDDVSAQALAILDRELPFDRVSAILTLALRRRRMRSARVCLESIGRRGGSAGVGLLGKVLDRERGELANIAAEALGATGSPAAEPPLIRALERDDEDLRLAAATALGRVGSAEAVPPLKEAAGRSSRLDRELRRATRQAIAEIQSRVQGASPGQLSLAGAEAGQLSLAGAEAGQLSLAKDPGGQLSLGGEGEADR